MELLLLVAAIAVAVLLRKQHVRLKALEADFANLRETLAGGVVPATLTAPEPVADTPPAATAETIQLEPLAGEAGSDEDAFANGPWQQAAANVTAESPATATVDEPKKKADIETALGARWAVWVGGLALALGGVFLVRYSIEAGLFGPGARLTAAALFGLALAAAGEIARRKGFRAPVGGMDGAHVPAILTAAAAFTLFAATYAAYGVYGFIGPATAFALLGALALATVGLALLHGQALAGLGLLGSYLTPMLVSPESPNPWALFVYLTIVLAATVAVASIRRWRFLASAAYVGSGLWSLAYVIASGSPSGLPVAMLHLAGFAMLAGTWLAANEKTERAALDPATIAAGLLGYLVTTSLVSMPGVTSGELCAALLIAAMLAVAAWRSNGIAMLHAAGISVVTIMARAITNGGYYVDFRSGFALESVWIETSVGTFTSYAIVLACLFLAGGVAIARARVGSEKSLAASWSFWAAAVPLSVAGATWLSHGNLNIDLRFAAVSVVLAALLAASAELVARSEQPALQGGKAVSFLLAGAAAAFCFALLTGFGPVLTTILTGLTAAIPAAATRLRTYPALGWLSAGFAAVTLVRIGIDPSIAGPIFLSTTPVFNALTPGYFLPAAAFAYAAWQLLRTTDGRPRLAMEAFAALFALMGASMLVRHAMNGGVIDTSEPTLAEQSIQSLILIGGGAILLSLDRRSPSPVFRWGSIALGVLSTASIAVLHFATLNPVFTNESTGTIAVANLILLGYLVPALAMAALAWRARAIRPGWYIAMLAACAAALGFAYISLSVRRIFQGEFIGAWKGMSALETYTYSAVWLVFGVLLLVAGLRLGSRALRLASGVLVVAVVAKVFVYDMRELEGVLRALSFIGLGGVLIGIGMFYQRMLTPPRSRAAEPTTET